MPGDGGVRHLTHQQPISSVHTSLALNWTTAENPAQVNGLLYEEKEQILPIHMTKQGLMIPSTPTLLLFTYLAWFMMWFELCKIVTILDMEISFWNIKA